MVADMSDVLARLAEAGISARRVELLSRDTTADEMLEHLRDMRALRQVRPISEALYMLYGAEGWPTYAAVMQLVHLDMEPDPEMIRMAEAGKLHLFQIMPMPGGKIRFRQRSPGQGDDWQDVGADSLVAIIKWCGADER